MQDHEKTKDQLIDELKELRRKVGEFEAGQTGALGVEKNLAESNKNAHYIANLLSPDYPLETEQFANVVDIPQIQSLMDDFYKLTNIGIAIFDLKGNVLVANGWHDICTKFHRVHPDTLKNCLESDLYLTKNVKQGEYVLYKCKNNMWDVVTPIFMGGKHVGNIFYGQFLFEDESPDLDLFAAQAEVYGFDKSEYLAALQRVLRWSNDKIADLMSFYSKLASTIGEQSYTNLKLSKTLVKYQMLSETLSESEERHRSLIEHLPQRIFIKDRNSVYLSCNANYSEQLGITEEKIVDKDDFAFHTPELARAYRADDQACMATGMIKDFEEPYLLAGQERWAHTIKVPYKDSQGRVIGVLGIFEDISDRKKAEMALRESEERYRAVVDNAGVGMDLLDQNGRIISVNQALCDMLGYSIGELKELTFSDITH